MPKTCIIYPEMDQTVGKSQKQSRTVITDSRNHEWKLRIKKRNGSFEQKWGDKSEYTYYFYFRGWNRRTARCFEA